MEKRALGHIEVIVSFVIFVSVVVLALYFFNPGDSSRLIESSLTYSFREIVKNTTVKTITYSLSINNTALFASQLNPEAIGINISGLDEKLKVSAETSDGRILESKREGDIAYVKTSAADWVNINFLFLRYNEDANESQGISGRINESWYKISTSSSSKLISEKRMLWLNSTYYSDYFGLKDYFNLPGRVNFGFILYFSEDDSIKAEKKIPGGFETFSDSKRVEVLRENGKIEFADLIIKVW